MIDGRREKAANFDDLHEAKAYLTKIDKQRRLGGRRVKAADFAERWPEAYPTVKTGPTRGSEKSPKTRENNTLQLKKFIAAFPHEALTDITRPMAHEFALAHPKAAAVARNMFSDALDHEYVDANPFMGLNLKRPPGRRDQRALSEAEFNALADTALDVYPGRKGQTVRALILFSAYVGARITETCHVREEDVDFDRGDVHLPICKFSKPRTVLLLPEAAEALRSMPPRIGSKYVFLSERGKQFGKSNHYHVWNPVRAAWWAGLSAEDRQAFGEVDEEGELQCAVDWHSLRHACGYHFYVTLDMGDELTAAQLGHADAKLVRNLYGHGKQDILKRMKEKLRNRRAA